jgi:hypothetical protein
MYCPMKLDCKVMTGIIHNCPNLAECLRNSPLNRMEAMRMYFLNLGVQVEESHYRSPTKSPESSLAYNLDSPTRDRLIFGICVDWEEQVGGIKNFYHLTIPQLEQLIIQRFANPSDRHNLAPAIGTFLEFGRTQECDGLEVNFIGYAVDPQRSDYRVSIQGINCQGDIREVQIEQFSQFTQFSSELTIDLRRIRALWS